MNIRTRMVIIVGSVLLIILGGAFAFIYISHERQAEELYRAQALAVHASNDMVAKTIAKYGGVWVEKKDGVEVGRYLAKIPGLTVEMEGKNGKKYALLNGYSFIQEMTALSNDRNSDLNVGFTFRAPTDKALNPVNKTTPEEQRHLDKMRKEGLDEYSLFTTSKDGSPLYIHNKANRITQSSCIEPCHPNYKIGAIEAIRTVALPIGKAEALRQESLRNIVYIFLAALIMVSAALFLIARYITSPIKELVMATNRFSKGEKNVEIDIKRNDEIGELAHAFNQMVSEVNRSQEELRSIYLNIVKAFVQTIEAKDPYTRGHSENVAIYSKLLGGELGFSAEQIKQIECAALLHDIGKIGIREEILNKPGKLTDDEYEQIKTHPDLSAQIIANIPDLAQVAKIIKHHHERYDGKGYTDGLMGEQIPLMSRILAIADAFDAMTSNRPYRQGCDKEEAFAKLRKGAGTQFDADLVESFIKVIAGIEIIHTNHKPTIVYSEETMAI